MLKQIFSFSLLSLMLLAIPALGIRAETAAAPDDLSEVLSLLSRNSRQVETLSCEFTQEKHLEILEEVLASTGSFSFQRPDRLRWEIIEPVSSGIIVSGKDGGTWHDRTGESEHFKVQDVPAVRILSGQLFAFATMDFDALKDQFQIALVQKEPAVILLTPHAVEMQDYIKSLRVTIDPNGQHVETVRMNESDGDYTMIHFRNVELNIPLGKDLFELP